MGDMSVRRPTAPPQPLSGVLGGLLTPYAVGKVRGVGVADLSARCVAPGALPKTPPASAAYGFGLTDRPWR